VAAAKKEIEKERRIKGTGPRERIAASKNRRDRFAGERVDPLPGEGKDLYFTERRRRTAIPVGWGKNPKEEQS